MKAKDISAVVLAGGKSSRMGQNKALLKLGDKTMIESVIDNLRPLFNEIILVTNHPEEYTMLEDIRFIRDKMILEERNSLVGIYSALIEAHKKHVFVVPCDMPFLNQDLIRYMINESGEEDVLIPFIKEHYQPLHAIYGEGCIEPIEKMLKKRNYRIKDFFQEVYIKTIDEEVISRFSEDLRCFINVNTYDEYLSLQKYLR